MLVLWLQGNTTFQQCIGKIVAEQLLGWLAV